LAPAKRLDKPRDDWTPEIVTLKHMAWILPALRTRIALSHDELSGRVAEHLGELLALEAKPVTYQRGLEASIAQGFKVDAQLNREGGVDPDALDLLQRARFWYSRRCLLHAVVVRVAYGGELPRGTRRVTDLLREREHPFVAATAELCERGLDEVLLAVGLPLIFFKSHLPAAVEHGAERAVGAVILLLALRVIVKWARGDYGRRPHAHTDAASTDVPHGPARRHLWRGGLGHRHIRVRTPGRRSRSACSTASPARAPSFFCSSPPCRPS
jgi:hypothetical protein